MAIHSCSGLRIRGIAGSLPNNYIANKNLALFTKEELQLFEKTTGVEGRYISPENIEIEDLFLDGAQHLMEELEWEAKDIELLVTVSQTSKYQFPGCGSYLQHQLGIPSHCMVLDLNLGCSGYVYGLSVVGSLLSQMKGRKALLFAGDVITKTINKEDKATAPIFSDAGTCTAIELDKSVDTSFFYFESDGKGQNIISKRRHDFMHMAGHDVFSFGLKKVVPNIETLLHNTGLSKNNIDYFVMHQANRLLNESIRKKLGVPREKFPHSIEKFANTSSATIPLTLISELKNDLKTEELQLVLCGFGVGLSLGTAYLRTSKVHCSEISLFG